MNYACVGTCSLCSQGRLIVARDDASGDLYVLCEECESEWSHPAQSAAIESATRDLHGPSTLLQRQELENHPWREFLW